MPDYAARATDEAIRSLERRIRDIYSEAQRDIEKKTHDFWERHRAKDAMYRQQVEDGKITEADYQAWLRGQVFQGKQWDAKMEQIEQTLVNANRQALNIVNGERVQVFTTNSNWQAYQIEKTAGVNFGFGIYDADTVTRLLLDEPDLLPPKRLNTRKDKAWNKANVNRQISQGIIQGEGLDTIAKRLRNVTDMNRNQSFTNARTMMTNAQNAGRQESYQRAKTMGIKVKKKWLATLDGHTRRNHRRLDGQTVDVDEPFKIGGYSIMYPGDRHAKPEMVYNCRCTMISEIESYPNLGDRYDNIAGKPIKNMTYSQWMQAKQQAEAPEFTQVSIARCKTVQAVSNLLNVSKHFTSPSNLEGCDLSSAKAIASAYQQTVERYPQLDGKIGGVTAEDLGSGTYARCFMVNPMAKKVQVSTNFYDDWVRVSRNYEEDVFAGWHPAGTTAEAIVTHEIGHAIDGILSDLHNSWEFKRTRQGNRIAKSFANELRAKVAMSTGVKIKDMDVAVSTYGSQNAQEWFAECYAEYITSANPRPVAKKFGELLEEELKKL